MPNFSRYGFAAAFCLAFLGLSSARAAPLLQFVTEEEVLTFPDTDIERAEIEGLQLTVEISSSARTRLAEFTRKTLQSDVLVLFCWSELQTLTVREVIDTSELRFVLPDERDSPASANRGNGSYCNDIGF